MAVQLTGRGSAARTGVTGVGTTSASKALTGSADTFGQGDVGRTITGAGIPVGATVASVTSDTAATLSANATATATVTVAFGAAVAESQGFNGWAVETERDLKSHTLAGVGAGQAQPEVQTDSVTRTLRYVKPASA